MGSQTVTLIYTQSYLPYSSLNLFKTKVDQELFNRINHLMQYIHIP